MALSSPLTLATYIWIVYAVETAYKAPSGIATPALINSCSFIR